MTEMISSHTREVAGMSSLRLAANIQQNKEERCRIQDEHERWFRSVALCSGEALGWFISVDKQLGMLDNRPENRTESIIGLDLREDD